MKKARWLAAGLAFLVCTSMFTPAFAGTKSIKKEFKFTSKTEEDLRYNPPKEIRKGEKTYKLSDKKIEYKITKSNKIKVTKTIFSDTQSDGNVSKEIREGGNKLAFKNVSWTENKDKVTANKTYDAENKITDTLEGSKTVDGRSVSVTLKKESVDTFTTPQNFTAPAVFIGHPDSPYYAFNNKTIQLINGNPKWENWQIDVANYLGLNKNEYDVNSMAWAGGFTSQGNNSYQRIATVSGIRHAPGWTAVYEETGADYKGIAVYEGIDGSKEVEAVATAYYVLEEGRLSTLAKIAIGAGAGVVLFAIALSTILMLIRKRRKEESI